jgi:tRNA(Ile)-lysidine synthase
MREHEMVAPGDTVLALVSGGPDSVCLLYSLWYGRRLFKIRVEVFHFDHRLRRDSVRDAEYVRRICARLRLPFHLRVATGAPSKGASVEAWASVARANAANDVRRKIGAACCAEGHTLDDQAETVLLNLVRGTGLEGIAGIDPGGRPSLWVQPLIGVTRGEVEAFCKALHLRPRLDPMNEERRYLRAAIRHDVLPAIERATGREVKAAIARTADTIRVDRDELYATAIRAQLEIVTDSPSGDLLFDVSRLRALPPSLASRVIRSAVYNALSTDWAAPWSKPAIESVIDLASGRPGRRRDLPNGRVAHRTRTHVVVTAPRESG